MVANSLGHLIGVALALVLTLPSTLRDDAATPARRHPIGR